MDVTVLNLVSVLALGQRIVISLDGTIRVLQDGESLQPGDVILESPNESQVSVKRFSPEDGSEVELEQDIANIFAALEEGQDPTELGEEFATEAGQNGSSISISATIERDAQETTPGTEFVTTGFEALGMSRTQSLSLLDAFRSIEQRLGTDNETIGDTTAPDAPTLTLDTDSGSAADDFLTNDGSFSVSGTEDGGIVEYLVDGEWTTQAPTPSEGANTITVRQTDAAGNTSGSSELTFTLDTTAPDAPQIALDTDSGTLADDFLTNDGSFTVSGTESGAIVEYLVDGEWTMQAPTPSEGANTITVRQTDAAGNISGSSELTFTLDTTAPDAPQIALDTDSGTLADDFLTNDGSFTVSGTEPGAIVEYLVDGEWTTQAPTPSEGANTIIVRQTDAAGNVSDPTELTFTLDTQADKGVVTVDDITFDDIISSSESESDIFVVGTATGGDISEGDVVSAVINGTTYETTVQSGGFWFVTVAGSDLVADTSFDVTVSSTDTAGNSVVTTGTSEHTVDSSDLIVNIDVDPITSDSIVNSDEAGGNLTVTGSVTGQDFDSGTVTLTINGIQYTGTVENGSYSIEVLGSDLASDPDAVVDASVSVSNSLGQTGSATTTEAYLVDTTSTATISIDTITDDNVLNETEVDTYIVIAGSVGGDAQEGDTVTVSIGGSEFSTVVGSDNTWSLTVAGSVLAVSDSVSASVTGADDSGNTYSATTEQEYEVDTAADAGTVTVDDITADDVINKAESGQTITVTGTATGGDISEDDKVTMTINGTDYETTVDADGNWAVDVAGSDLATDTEFEVVVTSTDSAGNSVQSKAVSNHSVAPIAVDDIASGMEDAGPIIIDVLINDSDADGDSLYIINATVPSEQGTVDIVDGKLEFTPANNFNGEATISYTISDGTSTDNADVVVTITGTNDAPVAKDATDTTEENTVLTGNVPAATDVDGTVDANGYE
ncbi:Ig-like domain-containing protein, partial [Vibrio toranzoniae]|uniref:Ig-like domain-containing protein n=1 Tax=Vibrio toranzoniae TaxID=1194427 RepID=UPI001379068D